MRAVNAWVEGHAVWLWFAVSLVVSLMPILVAVLLALRGA